MVILGRSHDGEAIWFDAGHGEQEATEVEVERALDKVQSSRYGEAVVCAAWLDESQILTLLAAFDAPHPLYPLVQCFCGDADAVQFIDGRAVCHGHAMAYAIRELTS